MRLDKFISQATDLSRREVHILAKRGAIQINTEVVRNPALQLSATDVVILNGQVIEQRQTRYLMLHKPLGFVCANSDSDHPTVLDLIDLTNKAQLQIVGRLDIDTTGLVLLTDDGQWNHRMTSPNSKCAKTYHVTTADSIALDAKIMFSEGILLRGEKKKTQPAQLELVTSHTARLIIHEGKYHQVKRMFAAVGNRVVSLHRQSIGSIELDNSLAAGEYRSLTAQEIASIGYD